MNIDDVKQVEFPEGDLVVSIFKHQHELATKYGPIERKNGFYVPPIANPPDIDDGKYQRWIKDMFWRVTEETAEAMESFPELAGWKDNWETDVNVRHFFEELSDALHFLVEVSLMVGMIPKTVSTVFEREMDDRPMLALNEDSIKTLVWDLIYQLGLAANCLKNKPWKTTQMKTDKAKFLNELGWSWVKFARLWAKLGCNIKDVYVLYMKKNAVNQFRQRTNY